MHVKVIEPIILSPTTIIAATTNSGDFIVVDDVVGTGMCIVSRELPSGLHDSQSDSALYVG